VYGPTVTLTWIRKGKDSWMVHHLTSRILLIRKDRRTTQIERISAQNDDLGPQKIWQPYLQLKTITVNPPDEGKQVRSSPKMGSFLQPFGAFAQTRRVVEFGAAFGVSGMYWLSAWRTTIGVA
jgi:predicted O-methyltransferase YrrM